MRTAMSPSRRSVALFSSTGLPSTVWSARSATRSVNWTSICAYRRAAPARSWLSVVVATCHPALSGPSRASAGTRTSLKNTSAKSAAPLRVTSGRASMPGNPMSTMRQEMPLCLGASGSVRTYS